MNLFVRELKSNCKAFCFWTIGMLFMIIMSAAKTTSMVGDNSANLDELFASMPKSIQTVFGVGIVDYSTAIGVFAIVFTYLALIAAFHAVSLGTGAFAKEERDKTFEFLYVKGMRRESILSFKLLSGLLQMIVLDVIVYLASIASVKGILGETIAEDFLPMMIGMFFLQILFYGIGVLLSFISKHMKTASNLSAAIVIITFVSAIASDFGGAFEALRYFTPFKFFDGKEMITDGIYWVYPVICLLICAFCIISGYLLHNKRDLHC